jgi:hypothetical protein
MGTPKPGDQSCIRMWMKPWRSGWRCTKLISISMGRWSVRRLPNSWRGYILMRQNSSSRADGWPNSSNGIRYGSTIDLARVMLQTRRSSRSPCHASAQSWTSMHLLTYTTWTKLGFSTICKSTTRLPPDSSKAASRTRSASPSLYAATLTGLTNYHSGSSASRFALAASRTSTSTASTISTMLTKMPGWHRTSSNYG